MSNQESGEDSSSISRDVALDSGICKASPRGDGGPPGGPLETDCISISSDSDDNQEPTARPSRTSSLSQDIAGSSSRSSNKAPVCVLVDSDEDSDYKHDVLALLDSDGEAAENGLLKPQQLAAIRKISSSSNLESSSSSSGEVLGVSAAAAAELEFPCIYDLFASYNSRFFGGRLSHVEVKWSSRMTLCAGLCVYRAGGYCSVRLSEPLLRFRSVKELKETLLHEMIHAFLFVTKNDRTHNAHGPAFLALMRRLNEETGLNITVFHNFHDEVNHYRRHVWRCEGPCRSQPPRFGFIRRAMNRAPGPTDWWWAGHKQNCGGHFVKIAGPPKAAKGTRTKGKKTSPDGNGSIRPFLMNESNSNSSCSSSNSSSNSSCSQPPHSSAEGEPWGSRPLKQIKLQHSSSASMPLEDLGQEETGHESAAAAAGAAAADARAAASRAAAEQRAAAAEKRAAAAAAAAAKTAAGGAAEAGGLPEAAAAAGGGPETAASAAAATAAAATAAAATAAAGPAVAEKCRDTSALHETARCPRCTQEVEASTLRRHVQCCIRENPRPPPFQ